MHDFLFLFILFDQIAFLLENKNQLNFNFWNLNIRPDSLNRARRDLIFNRSLRARLLFRLDCAFAFPRLCNAEASACVHRLSGTAEYERQHEYWCGPDAITDFKHLWILSKSDTLSTAPQSLFAPFRLFMLTVFSDWFACHPTWLQFHSAPQPFIACDRVLTVKLEYWSTEHVH